MGIEENEFDIDSDDVTEEETVQNPDEDTETSEREDKSSDIKSQEEIDLIIKKNQELEKTLQEVSGQKEYYQKQYKKTKGSTGAKKESANVDSQYLEFVALEASKEGYDQESLGRLKQIKEASGYETYSEAAKDEMFNAYWVARKESIRSKNAQLGGSTGSDVITKIDTSTEEGRKEKFDAVMKKHGVK